ncbi:11399_t:CDS:2, partial [Racocetra fulgida]
MSSSLAIEALNSIQLKELIDNRKSYTKTYRADESAVKYVKSMTNENMKEDNEVEVSLIAKLLNVDKKEIHDKDKIAKVLKGENGIWMTVAGKNKKE